MKKFIEEYGRAILVAIVAIILIVFCTPVGGMIKNNVLHFVNNSGDKTQDKIEIKEGVKVVLTKDFDLFITSDSTTDKFDYKVHYKQNGVDKVTTVKPYEEGKFEITEKVDANSNVFVEVTDVGTGEQYKSNVVKAPDKGLNWPVSYTVTFKDGDKIVKTENVSEGGNATPPTLSKAGHTLTWKGSYTNVKNNVTVTAVWTKKSYSYEIPVYSNTGKPVVNITISGSYGEKVPVEFPDKEGYTKPGNTTITITDTKPVITGKYDAIKYNITYNLNGGSVSGNPSTYTVESRDITLYEPTKANNTFLGWTGSNGSTSNKKVIIKSGSIGNKNYTANWKANTYTLTYNANGGNVSPTSKTLAYGAQYENLPTPTRTGFTFNGWFTAPSGGSKVSNTTTMVAGDTTIYAQWSANTITYNVEYKSSSGKSLGSTTISKPFGTTHTISAPAKTGYTTPTAQSVKWDSVNAKTITFTYPLIDYTISYNLNGGSVNNKTSYTIETPTFKLLPPYAEGHTFLGWKGFDIEALTKEITIPTGSIGDRDYYAVWTETFAIYSDPDKSLRFYEDDVIGLKEGDTYRGRIITKIYKNITNEVYSYEKPTPWKQEASNALILKVEDSIILPINTYLDYWFSGFNNVKEVNVSKLDTKNVISMENTFSYLGKNNPNGDNPATTNVNLNLSSWDTSNVTNMYYMFGCAEGLKSLNLQNWDTSKVVNMAGMFDSCTGLSSLEIKHFNTSQVTNMSHMFSHCWKIEKLDLSNWNTSNVVNMGGLFDMEYNNTPYYFGSSLMNELNLTGWDTSNVTDMGWMFNYLGGGSLSLKIYGLNEWKVQNVTNMKSMFNSTGYGASVWEIGDLSNWNISSVTNMDEMFYKAGRNSIKWFIGNVSNWKTGNVKSMSETFYFAGEKSQIFELDLSNWNVSNVTDMSSMFDSAGRNVTNWSIGDLSQWNVGNVTNMAYMFDTAGEKATNWFVGDLSQWNVSNVTRMVSMFRNAGRNATPFTLDLSGWDVSNVTNIVGMFYDIGANKIMLPKNISSTVKYNSEEWWEQNVISKIWYDETDNFREYPSGTFPVGFAESHTLVDTKPEPTYVLVDGPTFNSKMKEVDNINKIKSIEFVTSTKPTSGVIEILGLDNDNDGSVIGWYLVDPVDNMAKVYISTQKTGQKVIANVDSYGIFSWMNYLEFANFSNLDISNVKNFSYALSGIGYFSKNLKIEGLESWNTSNVVNMSCMFRWMGKEGENIYLPNISNWNTSNVTETANGSGSGACGLFSDSGITGLIDLSGWDLSNSIDNSLMFGNNNVHSPSNVTEIRLPKKLNRNANYYSIVGGTGPWYDKDNNYKQVNILPDDIIEGHTLVKKKAEAYVTFDDGVTLTWDELKAGKDAAKYNYNPALITDTEIKDDEQGAFNKEGRPDTGRVIKVVFPDTIVKIGERAFRGNKLTTVVIPNSVTSIGVNAFGSNKLKTVDIPSSVNTISDQAFYTNQLTSVVIPDTVTSIGYMAFGSNQLSEIVIPNSVKNIGAWAFYENQLTSVVIPSSINKIEDSVFSNNLLTSVTIPDSVSSIGMMAFYKNQLSSIEIPSSVKMIDTDAFRGNKLTSATLHEGITSLGQSSFADNKLTSITIPSTMNRLNPLVFSDNINLKDVKYNGSVQDWKLYVRRGFDIFKNTQVQDITCIDGKTSI